MCCRNKTASGCRLHEEIEDFYVYMRPLPEEQLMRTDIITRLSQIVMELWSSAEVYAGSLLLLLLLLLLSIHHTLLTKLICAAQLHLSWTYYSFGFYCIWVTLVSLDCLLDIFSGDIIMCPPYVLWDKKYCIVFLCITLSTHRNSYNCLIRSMCVCLVVFRWRYLAALRRIFTFRRAILTSLWCAMTSILRRPWKCLNRNWLRGMLTTTSKSLKRVLVIYLISVATGGLGVQLAPIRAQDGSWDSCKSDEFFLGGYPLCGGLALFIEGPFFLLQCLFSFQRCKLCFTQSFQKQRESTCSLLLLFGAVG